MGELKEGLVAGGEGTAWTAAASARHSSPSIMRSRAVCEEIVEDEGEDKDEEAGWGGEAETGVDMACRKAQAAWREVVE